MKFSRLMIPAVLAVLPSLPALAEEASGPGSLLKRAANVDEPIPETYEPLNSTYVGDGERLNDTIEESWQLREEAREKAKGDPNTATASPEREALEERIQEPGLHPVSEPEPVVTDTGDSLRIRGE